MYREICESYKKNKEDYKKDVKCENKFPLKKILFYLEDILTAIALIVLFVHSA